MKIIDNRKNDTLIEREIASFLDKNLYSNSDIFSSFIRTDGLRDQVEGSDVLLTTFDGNLKNVIVDEKVASRFANRNLETFSLELSFLGKNGCRREGWLLDKTKKTQYYLLGWIINADIPDLKNGLYDCDKLNRHNIHELDWALVSKEKIFEFLKKRGWDLEKLYNQEEKIRRNREVKTRDFINDVSFRYSKKYIEQPINILLKKDTYFEISDYNGKILA